MSARPGSGRASERAKYPLVETLLDVRLGSMLSKKVDTRAEL
jgi:hypothetical protein